MRNVYQEIIDEGNEILEKGIGDLRRNVRVLEPVKKYDVIFTYIGKMWMASCKELNITLEEGSFDALVVRMKVAIQDIVEVELGYKGDIELKISVKDRVEIIKAAS